VARTCVFCGAGVGLTREHVFGDWLTRIGLDLSPVAYGAGPLNRLMRGYGAGRPFRQTVRYACGGCNGGWMNRLEEVAKRVLTPLILGESGSIHPADHGAIAAWAQKTALVAMLVSPEDDRARGYGLPESEYHQLYDLRDAMEPLPDTQLWVGRYEGRARTASVWVVPLVLKMDGENELDQPQGYAVTIVVGQLLLHGARMTTVDLHLELSTVLGWAELWPSSRPISWPSGEPVDDATFIAFSEGTELRGTTPHLALRPWKRATALEESRAVGSMVELPTLCGEHVVYYPLVLVDEAVHHRFYAFITECECEKAYLIETELDGAHFKEAGTPGAIADLYGTLPGEGYVIEDDNGRFCCKRLLNRLERT
jgi:hypothetical protein